MGTTIHLAVQCYVTKTEVSSHGYWSTITLWNLGKAYPIQFALGECSRPVDPIPHRFPAAEGPDSWNSALSDIPDAEYLDSPRIVNRLPRVIDDCDTSHLQLYLILCDQVDQIQSLGVQVRVLYWTK